MKFRDLSVGDTFDWIDDTNPMFNSYYHRCVKTSMRGYKPIDGECVSMRVGSVSAEVFHVQERDRKLSLPATIWQAELQRRKA